MMEVSPRPLSGKTAIVTGSTGGIGLAIAEGLAKAGANVMLNGFGDADEIEQTRIDLERTHNVSVRYSDADMSDPDDIHRLAKDASAAFGTPPDILVNNAGVEHVGPIEKFPDAEWDLIVAINLSSAFHLTKATIPAMKAKGWGRIINISSAHGLVASPFRSAHLAAKRGIVGLSKVVALEGAEHGVTCNALCPGYVLTPDVKHQILEHARARGLIEEAVIRNMLLAAQPTKRFVNVEEVAGLTVFLCSDCASSITGAALPIEGGWTAH